jgi:hypothetical protein
VVDAKSRLLDHSGRQRRTHPESLLLTNLKTIIMNPKRFISSCLLILILSFVGCANLAPDGVYKQDKVLYQADQAITASFTGLHAFVKWEKDNRVYLKQWPEVKVAADKVRANARRWRDSAVALRNAYKNDPSAVNKKYLDAALDVLSQALLEATQYMAKPDQS